MQRSMENTADQGGIPEFELPRYIDTPYPYISIRDLQTLGSGFAQIPESVASAFEDALQMIRCEAAPEGCTFYQVDARILAESLEDLVASEVNRVDCRIGAVHMDRHIGRTQRGSRFVRLEVSRSSAGHLAPRVGTSMSVDEQTRSIASWANEQELDQILFVDDVVAYGDTLPVIIEKLREQGMPDDIKLRVLTGIAASGGSWNGIEKLLNVAGIDTEFLTKVSASPEIPGGSSGMAIPVSRDLTVFGGKITVLENGAKYIHPYMLPFSKPLTSIIRDEVRIDASRQLIALSCAFVATLQEYAGRTLLMQDLQDKNIGMPYTSLKSLENIMVPPHPDMPVIEYLGYARTVLDDYTSVILEECDAPAV